MKHISLIPITLLSALLTCASRGHAQGSAFTYQGRFNTNGTPYTGSAEFQATLWNAASAGSQVAANNPAAMTVPVTNGLFALPLDFGANFPGADRWLQLEVRTTLGPFTTLTPRQQLTAAPYAITAGNLTGTLPASQLSGSLPSANLGGTYSGAVTFNNASNSFIGNFTGNYTGNYAGDGSGVTNLNAANLASGTVPDARLAGNIARTNQVWFLNGNTGTAPGTQFIGTTDNQPLEIKVNGQRVVRWERQTNAPIFGFVIPNIVAGFESNRVGAGVGGATIAGGGGPQWYGPTVPHTITGSFSTIGGGVGNVIDGVVSTIAGGERGTISFSAYNSFLGGGAWNTIHSPDSTIGGGRYNLEESNGYAATIGGGYLNTVQSSASYATIGGGSQNTNNGAYSTVPGGLLNSAAASYSFAAGTGAQANHSGAFVWADSSSFGGFASTAANQFNVRASGGLRLVTAGAGLTLDGPVEATSFSGSGSGLSSLNAGNITSGTLSDAQLSANVALRNAYNYFLDIDIGTATSDYRRLRMGGGNSLGYLYGAYPRFGDGLHLSYNYYWSPGGGDVIWATDGPTSRLSVGYGTIVLAVGGVGTAPTTQRLLANSTGVTVNGTFNNSSDRNAKQDFAPVNPSQILEKVAQLPLSEWSYKDDPATRHVGPMGQDFYSTFNIGTDEKHIAPIDEAGVALAAIQGLNTKLEEELRAKDARIAELERRLAGIEKLLTPSAAK